MINNLANFNKLGMNEKKLYGKVRSAITFDIRLKVNSLKTHAKQDIGDSFNKIKFVNDNTAYRQIYKKRLSYS